MRIYIASAFSKNGSGGNKAGVCLLGEALNRQQKQVIAKEMGFSETVFISAGDRQTFKLEYFTPAEEVPLCGHATIAAFIVMRDKLSLKRDNFIIETKSGSLEVNLDGDMVFMQQNKPGFFEMLSKNDVAKCFTCVSGRGVGEDVFESVADEKLPIEIGSTGLRDIMLPIKSVSVLEAMVPNFDEISEVSRKFDTVGIHAFAIEGERIVCRNFAPLYDIPEESATGTSNCVLASYLWKSDVIRKNEYRFEQGYTLGSPSEIIVRLEICDGAIVNIKAGGCGYIIGEKTV